MTFVTAFILMVTSALPSPGAQATNCSSPGGRIRFLCEQEDVSVRSRSRDVQTTFAVTNADSQGYWFYLRCGQSGGVYDCRAPREVWVDAGETKVIPVTFSITNQSGQLSLRIRAADDAVIISKTVRVVG
ncbi:MAG: hypothetical protein ACOY71_03685 [Gemmatimonadota bacterium]